MAVPFLLIKILIKVLLIFFTKHFFIKLKNAANPGLIWWNLFVDNFSALKHLSTLLFHCVLRERLANNELTFQRK